MSKWLLAITLSLLGAMLVATDADAKRMGGGRSIGTQRSITNAPPASTPARPAQPQAAPQNGAAQQPAPASGLSRWLPMLGGLALGGLLGSMFGGSGLGGILLLALLAFVVVAVIRAMAARRGENAPQPLRTAGMNTNTETIEAPPASVPAAAPKAVEAVPAVPAGFDTAGFLRSAKMNFIRLQVANDLGKLDEIRDFTTQEMFDELRKDVAEGAKGEQHTDVVTLDADLLELATERDRHWASVRFSGVLREAPSDAPEGFEEVWNLVKPADGSSGWLLAGIQQMH